jgi:ATP-binding cassette subfamily B protein
MSDTLTNETERAVEAETLDTAEPADTEETSAEPRTAAEPNPADGEDIPVPPGAPRALLRSLMGPHRTRIVIAMVMISVQQAALQIGPLLVSIAIDRAIPALQRHDAGPLIALTAGYLGCAALATLLQRAFIRLSGVITATPSCSAWTSTSATPRAGSSRGPPATWTR